MGNIFNPKNIPSNFREYIPNLESLPLHLRETIAWCAMVQIRFQENHQQIKKKERLLTQPLPYQNIISKYLMYQLLFILIISKIRIPPHYVCCCWICSPFTELAIYGLKTSGMITEPSSCWNCSKIAGKIRDVAKPEAFNVCTYSVFLVTGFL